MLKPGVPVATYRLQLSKQFNFNDVQGMIDYLKQLGISSLYFSPIFKARPGSGHGYDVTDPTQLNPELGNRDNFRTLLVEMNKKGMGLVLDIVPNHMAVGPENAWWMDLLEYGFCSPYAGFFDIDWAAAGNKIVLPVLMSPYMQCIEEKEFILSLDCRGLSFVYRGYRMPIDIKSYRLFLSECLFCKNINPKTVKRYQSKLEKIMRNMERLPEHNRIIIMNRGISEKEYLNRKSVKERFKEELLNDHESFNLLATAVQHFNDQPDLELTQQLIERQIYKPTFWKEALVSINYRRFFDINDLIGIRAEEMDVFNATHALIFEMGREGMFTGLRIDHIDGLKDPLGYLYRLREKIMPEQGTDMQPAVFYIIAEKILGENEIIPHEWPVHGTTGYEYITMLDSLLIDAQGILSLEKIHSRFTGSEVIFDDILYGKKKQVLNLSFQSQVTRLAEYLHQLLHQESGIDRFSLEVMVEVIKEFTACLPIYRTYINSTKVAYRDRIYLKKTKFLVIERNPTMDRNVIDFMERVLVMRLPLSATVEQRTSWLDFVMQWQQLTGAVMAKGFEDSALYCYSKLVSLNEVGGNPSSKGLSIDDFHNFNLHRQINYPHTMNTTSSHDTKRSEDVRARINVLSEIPREWEKKLDCWSKYNISLKKLVNTKSVPDADLEILLYQVLIGAWPFRDKDVPEFVERLKAYMVKAAREAKVYTGWISPNPEYESALTTFIDLLVTNKQFMDDFLIFASRVSFYGAINSLSAVLLKITSPGIPDFYQGNELWVYSLVDPDNRRPVDFGTRKGLLKKLIEQSKRQEKLAAELLSSWQDGMIKLYITHKALAARNENYDLFYEGKYLPLSINGEKRGNLVSYARHSHKHSAIVVTPRLTTSLVEPGIFPTGSKVWQNETVILPEGFPLRWFNVFTGDYLEISDRNLPVSEALAIFPVSLLLGCL